MKLGLIIYGSLATVSGGYLYDRKLVEYLTAHGDEVDVISQSWSGYGRHLAQNFSRDLLSYLREAQYDVLLQDELNHPSLFWLNGRLRPHISYPLISIVHHLRSSEIHPRGLMLLYRRVERCYLRSVAGFVFNSQATRRAVAELAGEEERPFVVAAPAGDRFQPALSDETIAERCREAGPLRLLFVGNVMARKGLHTLLAALARLPADSWQLEVVGKTAVDPAYTRRLQAQIERAGLSGCLIWRGLLSDAELAAAYRRSHLLVVPSQYEGFGIVYLEGMSFGLPAVGTASGGAGEIIQDGVNGFLIGAGETAVLARRLRHLHNNRDDLARLSRSARRTFQAWPTWTESMAQIRAFLLACAKRKP